MSVDTNSGAHRQADIGEISHTIRVTVNRALLPLVVLLGGTLVVLGLRGDAGLAGFTLIAVGSLIALSVWSKGGIGLPLLPLIIIQHLVAYAWPIAARNTTVAPYTGEQITEAGWEVFLFCVAMTAAWRLGMQSISTGSALSYALEGLDERSPRLLRLGLWMIVGSAGWTIASSLRLLDPVLQLLPAGSASIITALLAAVSACGFFLTGIMLGRGQANGLVRMMFWALLIARCYIAASAFLLSSTVTVVFSAAIGLFWGSGRMPWRFLAVVVLVLSFFNLGKFSMREKYWIKDGGNPIPEFQLLEMQRYYGEWFDESLAALRGTEKERNAWQPASTSEQEDIHTGQSIFDRVNNLHNLLYVIDASEAMNRAPLHGATYMLIPPLLVPRILWPDKPRAHQGQVMLNVYYGRQDMNATHHTYIAWGLIPEAYGNFGPIAGSLSLGAVLGLLFAWLERFSSRKLLLSTEGFLAFTIFLAMANSFEMVASVLVTTIFQASIPIILATAPFVRKQLPRKFAPA